MCLGRLRLQARQSLTGSASPPKKLIKADKVIGWMVDSNTLLPVYWHFSYLIDDWANTKCHGGAGRGRVYCSRSAPLAFDLELFVSQHVKARKFTERRQKPLLWRIPCMIWFRFKEQIYSDPTVRVLVSPASSCSLNNAAATYRYFAKLT